jgi:hypothetical protein
MNLKFPRLLGEINDKDTQFTAAVKQYQEMVIIGGLIVVILIIFFMITSFSDGKRTGTWKYGLCKVFLEQYASYPPSLEILTAREKQSSAQIGYLMTNAYGAQKSELMECFYDISPQGITMARVTVDRRSLNLLNNNLRERPQNREGEVQPPNYQEIANLYRQSNEGDVSRKVEQMHIDEFNKSVNVILASDELDLEMPSILATNLEELKFN